MVEINYKVVIAGITGLTLIYVALLVFGREDTMIEFAIISVIAMSIGVVLPTPKIENKRGMLIW